MDELQTLSQQQENDSQRKNFTIAQNTTPLMPIAEKAKPFLPAYSKKHSTSPFALPHGHPKKYFMSGYMGFVPRLEKYFAQGYPVNTKRALVEFAEDGMRLQESQEKPFNLEPPAGEGTALAGQSTIYPKSTGLIPHYTGHIPGTYFCQKFIILYTASLQGRSSNFQRHLVPAHVMLYHRLLLKRKGQTIYFEYLFLMNFDKNLIYYKEKFDI